MEPNKSSLGIISNELALELELICNDYPSLQYQLGIIGVYILFTNDQPSHICMRAHTSMSLCCTFSHPSSKNLMLENL